jgi:hypothetical protein
MTFQGHRFHRCSSSSTVPVQTISRSARFANPNRDICLCISPDLDGNRGTKKIGCIIRSFTICFVGIKFFTHNDVFSGSPPRRPRVCEFSSFRSRVLAHVLWLRAVFLLRTLACRNNRGNSSSRSSRSSSNLFQQESFKQHTSWAISQHRMLQESALTIRSSRRAPSTERGTYG